MIPRIIAERLRNQLKSSKFILIEGPRKSGKRAFVESILELENRSAKFITCSELRSSSLLMSRLEQYADQNEVIVLEDLEFVDSMDGVIDELLSGKISNTLIALCSFKPQMEPEFLEALRLEGMAFYHYTPTFYEVASHLGLEKEHQLLTERLIYGTYPKVLAELSFAEFQLKELIQEVIDTHLGAHDRINKGDKMLRLLQLLAFEIGNPVSFHDLGQRCQLDNETVERYIDLLCDAHLLIKLPSYATGGRYELKKAHCFYFFDNGVRNALISNFNPVLLRNDMSELWKNYVVAERIKWARMSGLDSQFFFWRTHTRLQLDLIEISGETMKGYKMDWEKRKKVRLPHVFMERYPDVKLSVINQNTYWGFLTKKNG